MTEKKPALLLGDEAVELKIKPKACVLCGKPYIPTGPGAKFCPACRKMPRGKRNASLFAKHAELAFGKGPWATYTPEPDPVPDYFELAMDAARAIAHDVEENGLHIASVQPWYELTENRFVPMVNVTTQMFYKLFDLREYEYRHETSDRVRLVGWIDGVEVISWL